MLKSLGGTHCQDIAFVVLAALPPDPYGPFFLFQFLKDIKDHKTQDTQTTILPISAIFLVFLVLEGVFLFCSPFLSSSVRHLSLNRQKNDTKITNRHRVVSRAPCLDECFSISFFLSILKGVKTYFINILQYLM